MRRSGDPVLVTAVVSAVLVVGGFVALLLGWRGAADTLSVPLQLPYLVSGGLGGTALIALGLALANLTASRRETARELAKLQQLVDEAARALDAAELRRARRREAATASAPMRARSRAR